MATTIKTKNSTTASTAPTGLAQGELAVNITDKKLYVGDAVGNSIQIAGAGATNAAGGSNTQVQYNSSGALAGSANMTFNGTGLTLANDASISGLTVGKGAGSVSTNTAVGASALASNTTGAYGVAIGDLSLTANTSGNFNTAVGRNSSASNTTGSSNSSFGAATLYSNTTGNYNAAFGQEALRSNTTASNNTAVGYQAGYSNTTGVSNFYGGYQAGYQTTGDHNVSIGYQSMYASGSGSYNTAVGYQALNANTTGSQNTASGRLSLASNTTGAYNVAMGHQALQANTTASQNTAVGYQAGYSNTTAINNTFLGYLAGYTSTGANNTCIGSVAGYSLTTGTGNTFIGAYVTALGTNAGSTITTGSKNSILGSYSGNQGGLDIRTSSNYIVLSDGDGNPRGYFNDVGRFFVTGSVNNDNVTYIVNSNATPSGLGIGFSAAAPNNTTQYALQFGDTSSYRFRVWSNGNVVNSNNSYGSISDVSLKENIVDATPKLDKLCDVKVRNYNLIGEEQKQIGVIAQELEEVFPSMVDTDGTTGLKQVKYSVFVPMLIKAVQELKAEVDSLKQQLGK